MNPTNIFYLKKEVTPAILRRQLNLLTALVWGPFTVGVMVIAYLIVPADQLLQVWNLAKIIISPTGFIGSLTWMVRCVLCLRSGGYTLTATAFGWLIVIVLMLMSVGFLYLAQTIKL